MGNPIWFAQLSRMRTMKTFRTVNNIWTLLMSRKRILKRRITVEFLKFGFIQFVFESALIHLLVLWRNIDTGTLLAEGGIHWTYQKDKLCIINGGKAYFWFEGIMFCFYRQKQKWDYWYVRPIFGYKCVDEMKSKSVVHMILVGNPSTVI